MISAIFVSAFIVIFSFTEYVTGQTCSTQVPYGSCSSNSACACLPLSFSPDVGICALLGGDCSQLSPCQAPYNTCENANHICVQHSRCGSRPVCYPLVMSDQRICPPATATTYVPTTSTMATWTSTMVPWTSTMSSWTSGYSTWPSTTTMSQSQIVSTYSGALTENSEMFDRLINGTTGHFNGTANHFFQAIELVTNQSGMYSISSVSSMDTYGYLYNWKFSPQYPTVSLIAQDDDNAGNNQFRLTTYMEGGRAYTLVLTTYSGNVTGSFQIVTTGPGNVDYLLINTNNTTSNTSMSANATLIPSTYEGYMHYGSAIYPGRNSYYQIIEISVRTPGVYNFTSVSNMEVDACLYHGIFRPWYTNSVSVCDDDGAGNRQFRLSYYLQPGTLYTLVIDTRSHQEVGSYSIVTLGPDHVRFVLINATSTTTTTWYTSTTPMSTFVYSDVFGELTDASDIYARPNVNHVNGTNGTSNYFYQAYQLIVTESGVYNISSSSPMDTYGSLYMYDFSPFDPTNNLLATDDDSAGDRQFGLQYYLNANYSYTVVITTFAERVTGAYKLKATGPATIGFILRNSTNTFNSTWFPDTDSSNRTAYYSSALRMGGPMFARGNNSQDLYYYEAIRIRTDITGSYRLSSESSFDTFGYLYQDSFYPTSTSMNLLQSDDDSAGNSQFALHWHLQAYTNYILVVTSFNAHATGTFTAVASGPGNVQFYP